MKDKNIRWLMKVLAHEYGGKVVTRAMFENSTGCKLGGKRKCVCFNFCWGGSVPKFVRAATEAGFKVSAHLGGKHAVLWL